MKTRVLILASLLLGLLSGLTAGATETSQPASAWRLVYEQDAEQNAVSGSKEALIDAIRNGKDVRLYWSGGRVEHLADAHFLTIFGGEVFAQIHVIRAQSPSRETNPPSVALREEGQNWTAIFSTNGDTALKWFVQD